MRSSSSHPRWFRLFPVCRSRRLRWTCWTGGVFAVLPLLLHAQIQPPSSITIRGVVVSTEDQKPVPDVSVTLDEARRTAMTNASGGFEFKDVPGESQDIVVAKKAGFLCAFQGLPTPHCIQSLSSVPYEDIDMTNPKKITITVTLTMMPKAIVTGRIANPAGEPVTGLPVVLLQKSVQNGRYVWNVIGSTFRKTDADGKFRMGGLGPGTYLMRTASMVDPQEGRHDRDHGYAATWYPGAPRQDDAKPLVLAAGQSLMANLVIANEKFQLVTLSWARNQPGPSGSIGMGLSGNGPEDYLDPIWDEAQQAYRLYAPAGHYRVNFTIYPPSEPGTGNPGAWPDGSKESYFGSAEFSVQDQPVTITGIRSQQPIDIPVHVSAQLTQQDKRKAAMRSYEFYRPPRIHFEFRGDERGSNPQTLWDANVPESEVVFKKVMPGVYAVNASPLNGSFAYVASLTCGSTNLLRDPLVIGPGTPACSIEAVVRDDLASLTVGLTAESLAGMKTDQVPVSVLALIPVENPMQSPMSTFAGPDHEAKDLRIPPGTWLAVLFDGRSLAWREPVVWEKLMKLGKVITIGPGQSETVQLNRSSELNDPRVKSPVAAFGAVLP
jgi:Carboxypeptidase regulatory-like domain